MKAHLIEVGAHDQQSFSIKKIDQQHFSSPFHFHELCEMNYVVESYGKRIVGDNISNFSNGDLVLMSSNLPHIWYNDPLYFKNKNLASAKAIVIYFNPRFLTGICNESQYNVKIKDFLDKAKRGIRFYGTTHQLVTERLLRILDKNGLERVIEFLDIINLVLASNEYEYLASVGYQHSFNEKDTERMNNVYQYLIKNFTESVTLPQVAAIANLTPPAFCNFFKKRTQRSFTGFLNDLRIGHACKLLQNPDLTIADVCFQSGYQNMANFNNFFKKITKKTPSQYRKDLEICD